MTNCIDCLHYKACQMWATICLGNHTRFPFFQAECDYFKSVPDIFSRDDYKKLIDMAIDVAVCKDNGDGTERLFVSIKNLRKIIEGMKDGEQNN